MEYHFVPPEERARDEKGNILPWGYVYKEYVFLYLTRHILCYLVSQLAPMISREYH